MASGFNAAAAPDTVKLFISEWGMYNFLINQSLNHLIYFLYYTIKNKNDKFVCDKKKKNVLPNVRLIFYICFVLCFSYRLVQVLR